VIRAAAAASLVAAAAIAVTPIEGGCAGTNLHWWVLEPVGRALGVHGSFQQGAALWPLVGAAPLGVMAVGAVTAAAGAVGLRRRAGGSAAGGLAALGTGGFAVLAAGWALVLVAVH
jgi:hypothetical protein